jgi:NAD-dependent dihydropyrimidine dehydrogenase PreA subunit
MPQITILENQCTLCRVCVKSCPVEILRVTLIKEKRRLTPTSSQECLECRACEVLCTQNAIYVDP